MKRSVFPNRWLPYLLVGPQVIITLVFFFWPAFESLRLSLYRASPFGDRLIYVGLTNFERLFRDDAYLRSVITSFVFSFVVTFAGLALALLLASMANARIRGLAVYRSLLLWPYGIAPAIAGIIWLFVFHPSYGILPWLLSFVTAYQFNWFLKGWVAMALIILAAIWKQFGYNLAFYLAGLQAIESSVLDAASVGGPGSRRGRGPTAGAPAGPAGDAGRRAGASATEGLARLHRPRDPDRLGGPAGVSPLLRVRHQHADAVAGHHHAAEAVAVHRVARE